MAHTIRMALAAGAVQAFLVVTEHQLFDTAYLAAGLCAFMGVTLLILAIRSSKASPCRCKLFYKFPESSVGYIELNVALCADPKTLEAIEILGLGETSRCNKCGGCPWLKAEREGGKTALREKLLIHAASSLYAPDRADSGREVALVQHPDGQPVAVDAAAGESVTVHKPTLSLTPSEAATLTWS